MRGVFQWLGQIQREAGDGISVGQGVVLYLDGPGVLGGRFQADHGQVAESVRAFDNFHHRVEVFHGIQSGGVDERGIAGTVFGSQD